MVAMRGMEEDGERVRRQEKVIMKTEKAAEALPSFWMLLTFVSFRPTRDFAHAEQFHPSLSEQPDRNLSSRTSMFLHF